MAVARLHPVGGHAHGDQEVLLPGQGHRRAYRLHEAVQGIDEVVGVEGDKRGVGVTAGDLPGGPGEHRAGAPGLGLHQEGLGGKVRDGPTDGFHQVGAGEDTDVAVVHQRAGALHGVDDQGAVSGQREDLLGTGSGAHRPEAGADAAGENQDPEVGISAQRGSPGCVEGASWG